MSTVSSRITTVQLMLGNRTDLADRIPIWIANGYIELASNIPFADLEESDQLVTVSNIDTYDYPSQARGILATTILVNNQPRPIKKKNIEYIDNYPTTGIGIPVIWAPFHYKQILRPVPDGQYTIIRRFWKKPIVTFTSTATINASTLNVPDDWLEVIDYAAAMRGFMELKDREKARDTRIQLYGDPKDPTNPGLVKQHLTQIQAENMNSDYGMRMRIRSYTS